MHKMTEVLSLAARMSAMLKSTMRKGAMQKGAARVLALLSVALVVAASTMLTACTDDVESVYDTTHRAGFQYGYVATVPQLLAALTSPGEYCTITFSATQMTFTNADG